MKTIKWVGCQKDHKLIYFNIVMSDCPACEAIIQAEVSVLKWKMEERNRLLRKS